MNNISIGLVTEFARDAFGSGWTCESISDECLIFQEQMSREMLAEDKNAVVITDSPVLLPYVYGLMFNENTYHDQVVLMKLYECFVENIDRYDLLIFINRDHPYIFDGVREAISQQADEFGELLKNVLKQHKVEFTELKSTEDVAGYVVQYVLQNGEVQCVSNT